MDKTVGEGLPGGTILQQIKQHGGIDLENLQFVVPIAEEETE